MRSRIKRLAGSAVLAAAVLASAAVSAEDKLVLQLKWVPQSQFAGYYVAQAKGFYKQVGLDVAIVPGGPAIAPSEVLARGGADVVVEWMPAALAAREKGAALVNIAQVFTRSGMMLTCRKETGVRSPADLKGRTLGVWFAGNEYPFLAWMSRLGLKFEGATPDVKILRQGFDVEPLLSKQADCISTMTYNEYWQVLASGLKRDSLVVFKYQDLGVATLEDGLYTTAAKLADPATADRLARFVAASLKGWNDAVKNRGAAVRTVLTADVARLQNASHQAHMLDEVAKLIHPGSKGLGYLDPAAYERTVATLLAGGSDPVISRKPDGAWTHAVWEAAQKYRK
ncbi:MAG: ABC transporter substrate-binding protein [Alphaproteobacteria bacterium]|nr:ABC transporter substrate-binding protein [Alphaproteobacteria bacterium]